MVARQDSAIKRLAIVSSHPIQYNAPWFALLAATGQLAVKVFYTWEQSQTGTTFDKGFGKVIQWDIPLLEGYDYTFVKNVSANPGSNHFKGIVNPDLNKEIASWNPDAVLVFGWSFQSHLKCLRYFHGKVPVLFRGDSTLLDERAGVKQMLRRLFLSWVYRHVDHALYAGTNNKAYFQAHGLTDKQLVFAPHAIDNKRFAANDEELERKAQLWRSELGYTKEDKVVLYAGKLEPVKDTQLLLAAAKQLSDKGISFLLVGNGELEQSLKAEASSLINVRFLGFQNQGTMPLVYRLGDVFILPSKSETWGLALNEAMACGRAIMASDKVGGAVDLIHPGKNGFIFQSGNSDDLTSKLLKLMESDLVLMGQYSKSLVEKWSFGQIIEAVTDVVTHRGRIKG